MTKKKEYYYILNATATFISGCNSVISTDASLFALKKYGTTQKYIYKSIFGQSIGLGLSYLFKDKINDNEKSFVLFGVALQQTGFLLVTQLYRFPKLYLPLKSAASAFTSASWIIYGSVNAKCITNISNDIPKTYSELSIINTVAASAGMYAGTKLNLSRLGIPKVVFISSVFSVFQAYALFSAVKVSQN